MKILRSTIPALALAACATVPQESAQPAAAQPARQSAAPNIDAARMAAHVRTLASDEFLGRGPATPGEEKTVE
ncbi:MAG: peptidase M20, partial [Gemmatimonadetes bacterium]|nr:peptidase M20 [Gemmatimonadota bacterium]